MSGTHALQRCAVSRKGSAGGLLQRGDGPGELTQLVMLTLPLFSGCDDLTLKRCHVLSEAGHLLLAGADLGQESLAGRAVEDTLLHGREARLQLTDGGRESRRLSRGSYGVIALLARLCVSGRRSRSGW
jgi:hypothetical protein